MSKFKAGDRVVCILANGTNLVEGQDYIVTGVIYSACSGSSFVEINGDTSLNFWESRFESVEQPSKLVYDLPVIDVAAVIGMLEDYEMEKEDILNYLNGYIDGAKGGSK